LFGQDSLLLFESGELSLIGADDRFVAGIEDTAQKLVDFFFHACDLPFRCKKHVLALRRARGPGLTEHRRGD